MNISPLALKNFSGYKQKIIGNLRETIAYDYLNNCYLIRYDAYVDGVHRTYIPYEFYPVTLMDDVKIDKIQKSAEKVFLQLCKKVEC